jgi:hypothetical protein
MAVRHSSEAYNRYFLEHSTNPSFGPKRNAPGNITEHRAVINSGSVPNKAAMVCSPAIFALLLSHGSGLSRDGAIQLHYTANHPPFTDETSRIPMLEYLVDELGIDVNTLDDAIKLANDGRGHTGPPLHCAIKCGHVEEVQWLLDRGANPHAKTPWSISAIDYKNRLPPGHAIRVVLTEWISKLMVNRRIKL